MIGELFGVGKRPTRWRGPAEPLLGKYRGLCTATNDPAMRGRIRARVPYPFKDVETEWAEPCFPPGMFIPPTVNDGVWIEFEHGDATMPIWSGMWYRNAEAPFQAPYDTLQQDDEEANTTPVDDAIHRAFHDHKTQWYSPHARGWRTPTGHYILFDDWRDEDGQKFGLVRIADRNGRSITLSEKGIIDIYVGANGWVRLDETGKIIVNANQVYLGTEAGAEPLMTKTDADRIKAALDALRTHTHPAGALASPSGAVTGVSGAVTGVPTYTEALTDKTKGD